MDTIFTDANQNIQDRPFVSAVEPLTVRLLLETAGPVSVSTRSDLFPIGSGKGIQLSNVLWTMVNLDPGQRLFIGATGINRVAVIIGPRDSIPVTPTSPPAPQPITKSPVAAPPWKQRF